MAWAAIERSWTSGEKNLYGRFDLRYDGRSPPQLLEYNADTPTAVFEAAVVQWDWLEQLLPGRDQFNSIHEKLIEAWRRFGVSRMPVYFTAVKHHVEDGGTVDYLRDTAIQAGLDTARIDIEAHAPLPVFDGNYPVIGSWVVASTPAGIGIREDDTPITRDTSRFLPHYFE